MYLQIEIISETEMLVYNYASEYDADNGSSCVSIDTYPLPKSIEKWAAENGFQIGDRGYFKIKN
jgi:hypothetical protein